ncbi:MAG: transketolase [Armatimonadota bacterium]
MIGKKPRVGSAQELDNLCINTIRFLSVDAVQKANSGHPGLPLGAAPMAYVLWDRFMRYNPANPAWFNRDRFILSAGHGSMLLYSLLYLTGYDLPLEQIKQFRQWHSMTPGHSENVAPGVEVTTGPLGQGFANGVGLAIAEANLAARYNRPGFDIVDHYVYSLVSDGDLMEGISSEAGSLAGELKLGKLIYLYDNNHITLSASTKLAFTEDRRKRFEAFGWHTITVEDGNNLNAIDNALREAREQKDSPSLILATTHIGYGSPNKQDTVEAHGSPLGEEEVELTKENLGWPVEPAFYVPDEALDHFRQAVDRGRNYEDEWNRKMEDYEESFPDLAEELRGMIAGKLPDGWDSDIPAFPPDTKGMATRVASGKVMNAIAPKLPLLIGGSADLNPSTYTALTGLGDFQSPDTADGSAQGAVGGVWSYAGRNIAYGVREHAMGAISNGIAAHAGLLPFCATFLIFADYMRPSMRLAALSNDHVIYVLTHDSIWLGEDGPTHQPVEQLANLRAIPRMVVIRPCDANETVVAWKVAIETRDRPVALILTRQNVPTLERGKYASADNLRRGAYVLSDPPNGEPDIILIATGSEVNLIVQAQERLFQDGINARIVSMPSWELFDREPQDYRDSVLSPSVTARLAVEAGSPQGWCNYTGDKGDVIGLIHFGASAPADKITREFGFTVENVYECAKRLVDGSGRRK